MTYVNETGAYQEMCAAVRAVVQSPEVKALVGYSPELRYVDVTYKALAPKDKVWLRFSIIQGGEKRRTLAVPSRVCYQGVADLQLFTPITVSNAAELSRKVADLLKLVYAKSTPAVDFYLASIKDMPSEDAWFYKRVNATYNYEQYV